MRKIAVVTTSRAEYGLLYWLVRRASADRAVSLQLLVSGTHLSSEFGGTARAIAADGFPIAARIRMLPARDTDAGVARSLGDGMIGFSAALSRLRPDVLVVLGDRFELLAPCAAAVALRIPIAHLHGGEATEGVIDEQVRHAITKLAWLHFTAAEPYRARVIRMGEHPSRVFNTGAPGLEAIARLEPASRAELENTLKFDLSRPFALVTHHPTDAATAELDALLQAIDDLGLAAVLTFANADAGGRAINRRLERFVAARRGMAVAAASLGQRNYLSLMRLAAVVAGNSSSGLLEAPTLKVPTVNIGDRQRGRLRAPSVIDCAPSRAAIARALRRALSPAFRKWNCRGKSPYGGGPVSERVLRILKTAPLPRPLQKPFYEPAGAAR